MKNAKGNSIRFTTIMKAAVAVYLIFFVLASYKEMHSLKQDAAQTGQSAISVKIDGTERKMYCTNAYLDSYNNLHLTYESYDVMTGYTTCIFLSFYPNKIRAGNVYYTDGTQNVLNASFNMSVCTLSGTVSKISPFAIGKDDSQYLIYNGDEGFMSFGIEEKDSSEQIYSGIEFKATLIEDTSGEELRIVGEDIVVDL